MLVPKMGNRSEGELDMVMPIVRVIAINASATHIEEVCNASHARTMDSAELKLAVGAPSKAK